MAKKSVDITQTYFFFIDLNREYVCFILFFGGVDDHQFKMASAAKCKQTNKIRSHIDG